MGDTFLGVPPQSWEWGLFLGHSHSLGHEGGAALGLYSAHIGGTSNSGAVCHPLGGFLPDTLL